MKTTIDIADSLFEEVKKLAANEGTTVRAFVEQGLRQNHCRTKESWPVRLRKVAFKGKGLQSSVENATWEQIRETVYQGRGG